MQAQPADAGCVHGPWKYAGRAPSPRPGSSCMQPAQLVCMACGLSVAADCQTSRSAQCEPCGLIYRGRVQRVARVRGDLLMLTLTAPGTRAHSVRSRSGAWVPCPCTPAGGIDLARWNAGASVAWSRMLNNGIRRDGHFTFLRGAYFRVAEVQRRGALHFHILVRVVPGEVITPRDVHRLTAMAMDYGFGHRVDLAEIDAGRGAHYVAKYVAKAANERPGVPWARDKVRTISAAPLPLPERAVPNAWAAHGPWQSERTVTYVSRRATYRTWSSSVDWPNTMQDLRAAQAHYAEVVAALPDWAEEPLPSDVAVWLVLPAAPGRPPDD